MAQRKRKGLEKMSRKKPENNNIRHKLVLVETLILAIPLLVLSYIFYQSGYKFEYYHLILLSMTITLILVGLIIVRQIFDKISIVAVSLKKVEAGDTFAMDIRHDIAEFHDISNTFNNLVKKLEETTEGLRQSHFELLTIKDITEIAKEVRDIDNLFEILLEKSMSVTGAHTGSVLMIEVVTTNKESVLLPKQRESASNYESFHNLRVVAARGHNEALEKDSFIDITNYVAKNVLIDEKPLLIQDIEKDTRTLKTNDPQYGPPSFLSMPIFAENKLVAVMNLSNKSRGQLFDSNDEKILSIMLGEIGFALENVMIHSSLEKQLRKIKEHNIVLEKEIESHRRTEKARSESEKKYKELLDLLPIAVFEIDPKGNVTTVNHTILEAFGYTQDDIVAGLNALQMFVPEDLDRVMNDIQRVLNGGKMDSAPYTMIKKDGSTFPVLISASPITYMNVVVGFRGAIIDFTERRQAEKALQESEAKYKFLADKMTDIVWIQDMNLRTVYVSPSIETALGFSPEERIAQDVHEQLTPTSMSIALDVMAKELALEQQGNADPERKITIELEYYHKDGSTRWFENILSGIRNTQGVLTGIHGVSRDITRRRQAEQALRESERQ
jgi:PAS domain S-box-containing protein